jgi:hypothetical protein
MSTMAEILAAASKFREERVEAGGVSFLLREFNGTQRDAYEQTMIRTGADGKREVDLSNARARLIAPCLVNEETGDRDFAIEVVEKFPFSMLEPLWIAAQRINGMGADAAESAVKNSEGGASAASTSASPSP